MLSVVGLIDIFLWLWHRVRLGLLLRSLRCCNYNVGVLDDEVVVRSEVELESLIRLELLGSKNSIEKALTIPPSVSLS